MAEFDEYPAFEAMRAALPALVQRDGEIAAMEAEYREQSERALAVRAYERLFQRVMRMWARGEAEAAGVETWEAFMGRVGRGLAQVRREAGRNSRVVVFTSGGPVAVAVREALGLSAETTMELSWASRNGSYSEFLFSGERFSLGGFNLAPIWPAGPLKPTPKKKRPAGRPVVFFTAFEGGGNRLTLCAKRRGGEGSRQPAGGTRSRTGTRWPVPVAA